MKEGMKRNQKYINYLLYLQSFLPFSSILYPCQPFPSWVFFTVAYFSISLFYFSLQFCFFLLHVLPFHFFSLFLFFYSVISLSTTAVPTPSVLWLFILIYLQKSFVQFWLEKTEWPQVLLFMRSRKNIKHMHNSKQVHFAELGLPTLWNIFAWISRQVVTQFCLRIDQQRATWTYY